jgi:hypothetical protein
MQPRLKVGRNDRCPCGSGRKFKVCHGWLGVAVDSEAADQGKASAALLEVAKPLLDGSTLDRAEYESRLKVAMLAWNLALLENHDGIPSELQEKIVGLGMWEAVDQLVRRKLELFPADDRSLLGVVVTEDRDLGFHVQVVSSR